MALDDHKVKKARSQLEEAVKAALKIVDLGYRAIILQSLGNLAMLYGFNDIAYQIYQLEKEITEQELRMASLEAYSEARRAEGLQYQAQDNAKQEKKALGLILDATLNMLGFVPEEMKAKIAKTGNEFYRSITDEAGAVRNEIKTIGKLSTLTDKSQTVTFTEIKGMLDYLNDKPRSTQPLVAAKEFDYSINKAVNKVRATPEGKKKYTELDTIRQKEINSLEELRKPAATLIVAAKSADLKDELKYYIKQHRDANEQDSGIETTSFAEKFFASRNRNNIQDTIENIKARHHNPNKKSMLDLITEQEQKEMPYMGRSK